MKNEGWIGDMFGEEQCKAFNRICDRLKWCRQYFSKIWTLIKKCFSKIWKKCISYLKYGLCGNKIIKEQREEIENQKSKIRELEEKEKELNKIKEDMNSEKTLLNKQRETIKYDLQRARTKLDEWHYTLTEEGVKILSYFGFGKKSYPTSVPDDYKDRYVADICKTDYEDFENQIDTNTSDEEFLDKIKKYDKNVYDKQ